MGMATTTATEQARLYRLMAWLSPAFPTGGFSYSHGLEYAVEAGLADGRDKALAWIDGVLRFGAGRMDAGLFALAFRAVAAADDARFLEVAELAAALRGTAELKLEAEAQGRAFLLAVETGWASERVAALAKAMAGRGTDPSLPVSVALAAAAHGLSLEPVLQGYVQAFAANLVSAAVRLVPLGQSDGLRLLAALEPATREAVSSGLAATLDGLGAAAPTVDWCSMRHETQYTRLFRS